VPPYTYNWSNGSSFKDVSGLTQGSYSVDIYDVSGSSKHTVFTISKDRGVTAGFKVSVDSINLSSGGTLQLINTSNNATTSHWSFGDGTSVSSLKDPIHTYTHPGVYTIMLISSNGFCMDTTYSSLTVTDNTSNINTIQEKNKIKLFTVNGRLGITLDFNETGIAKMLIYNINGQKVMEQYIVKSSIIEQFIFDLSDQVAGIYLLNIELNKRFITQKFRMTK
jgi:hypothetical protein